MGKQIVFMILIIQASLLNAQEIDTSYYLEFNTKGLIQTEEGYDLNNHILKNEFTLLGEYPIKYSVEIINNKESVIRKYEDNKWETVDTIDQMYIMLYKNNELLLPLFRIEDFNKDGNQDLICQTGTNVNGNEWVQIYLNDPKTKSLIKLINTAEKDSFIWDAPEYNEKDSTINCTRVSGAFGLSFESKYRLIGNSAIPIEKRESDRRNIKVAIERIYIGENGKWKLTKTYKIK